MTSPREREIFQRVVLNDSTTRGLADAIATRGDQNVVRRRWGIVTAITHPTVSVNVGGIVIPGVQRLANYTPTTGERVELDVVGSDLVVVGATAPSPLNESAGARLDQIPQPLGSVDFNAQRLVDLGAPVGPTDAATKAYVDANGGKVVARGRRTNNTAARLANDTTPANAIKITELTANVVAGRTYKIFTDNLGVYTDNATETRGLLTYTTNNTAPSPTSAILQWAQVESPAGGRVKTLVVSHIYVVGTSHTLRVLLSTYPTVAVAGNFGVYSSPEWPLDFLIVDMGPTVAASGTQF